MLRSRSKNVHLVNKHNPHLLLHHCTHGNGLGPTEGKMLLVIIDTYSKWVEAILMGSTSAARTIVQLRKLFARFGLLTTNSLLKSLKISVPLMVSNTYGWTHYHRLSNGLADRAVRVVKEGLKKQNTSDLLTD